MKKSGASIVLSTAALVLLAVLRVAGAGLIIRTVPAPYGQGLVSVLGVLTVLAVAVVIDRLVRLFYWDGHLLRRRKRDTPALIQDLFTIALVVLGVSIGLFFEAGVSFAGLLTASGATAIVVGIALQAVIQDVFSGLSLNFDGSYVIGDWVTVYSDQFPDSVYGRVEGITWRTTFLRLSDGRRLMVPNHLLTSNPVMNHSRPSGPNRLFVEVPIDNRFPAERAISILLGEAYRVVRESPLSEHPAPDILINRFDSDSTYFHVRFYADPKVIEPQSAISVMAVALHRTMQRHRTPSPVSQIELVPDPGNFDFEATEERDALRQVSLFKNILNAEQIDSLVANCDVRTLPSKTVFIRQGEAGTSMFVMLEGAARIFLNMSDGEVRDVAVLVGGDIVGEMSLMTGAPRTATVESLTPVRMLEVTKEAMEILIKAEPKLLEQFSAVLTARQLALNEIAHRLTPKQIVEMDILDRMTEFFLRAFR